MSGQAEVDVSYRGLSVGAGLRMRDVGPTTAYVELAHPMPVGAQLEVAADGVRFAARVVHVREKTEGGDIGAMRIAVDDIGADARAWWDALVTTADPVPAPAPAPPEPEPQAAAAPEEIVADATDAIPEQLAEPEARRTLMMSAADLAEIQSMAQQQSAEEFARREAEAAAAGVDPDAEDDGNGDDATDDDDDDDKKKKKKRKRNKKKR